jgi:peptide/nickel transport system substrate-binding protein
MSQRKLAGLWFLGATAAALLSLATAAQAGGTLRIAMTASDVPTTTGAPDNGFEGMRFLGYPIYEGLVLWDLSRTDKLAEIRPGLAESWEQDENDKTKWIFHLRRGVKFHDGSEFNADAAIWNLDRYFKADAPQFDPTGAAIARGRNPWLTGYRKIDDQTIELANPRSSKNSAHGRSSPRRRRAPARSRSPSSSRASASH